jgi:hypothetical protein
MNPRVVTIAWVIRNPALLLHATACVGSTQLLSMLKLRDRAWDRERRPGAFVKLSFESARLSGWGARRKMGADLSKIARI